MANFNGDEPESSGTRNTIDISKSNGKGLIREGHVARMIRKLEGLTTNDRSQDSREETTSSESVKKTEELPKPTANGSDEWKVVDLTDSENVMHAQIRARLNTIQESGEDALRDDGIVLNDLVFDSDDGFKGDDEHGDSSQDEVKREDLVLPAEQPVPEQREEPVRDAQSVREYAQFVEARLGHHLEHLASFRSVDVNLDEYDNIMFVDVLRFHQYRESQPVTEEDRREETEIALEYLDERIHANNYDFCNNETRLCHMVFSMMKTLLQIEKNEVLKTEVLYLEWKIRCMPLNDYEELEKSLVWDLIGLN